MDAACLAGNPDIRVPETVKTDDGLRAGRVGEEGDAERHGGATKGGPEETEGRPTSREPRKPVVQERIETGEEPEERELRQLRHVPGGTWLNQCKWWSKLVYMEGAGHRSEDFSRRRGLIASDRAVRHLQCQAQERDIADRNIKKV
ncbi:hypothetical protein NDU88_005060 [Pleurodeles waltl]|uniref:Uncharacterized protein n=1 Tax=Pleurodeles waltl TaxID=8319 RepID=A0AAV7LBG6_PLEWA|nr:hypothetical protein NDU88_005060 [Pleurodeles waltl]